MAHNQISFLNEAPACIDQSVRLRPNCMRLITPMHFRPERHSLGLLHPPQAASQGHKEDVR